MVNTRKKSYIGGSGDESNQPETSESLTASATRRLTRRSVSNVATTPSSKEVATPVRRSRRLSNSSVESVTDTPVPTKSATRRSVRSKNTESGDESSDLEVLVIKRRRGAKDAPGLGPITEEKTNDLVVISVEENAAVVESAQVEMKEEAADTPLKASQEEKTLPPKETPEKPIVVDLRSPPQQLCKEELSPQPNDGRTSALSEQSTDSFKSIRSPNNDANQTTDNIQLMLEASGDEAEPEISVSAVKSPEKGTPLVPEPEQTTNGKKMENPEEQSKSDPTTLAANKDTLSEENIKKENQAVKLAIEKQAKKSKKANSDVNNRLLKIANKKSEANNNCSEKNQEKVPSSIDMLRNIPRGKPKSGRTWKQPKSNPRYMYQDKGMKMGLDKVTQLRQERQRIKELEARLKEEKQAKFAELARRRELNKKREEENARRGEVVQVIRNPNKIKRMKKKQLKLIQKRDTTGM